MYPITGPAILRFLAPRIATLLGAIVAIVGVTLILAGCDGTVTSGVVEDHDRIATAGERRDLSPPCPSIGGCATAAASDLGALPHCGLAGEPCCGIASTCLSGLSCTDGVCAHVPPPCGHAGEDCCPVEVCFGCTGPTDPERCCTVGTCAAGALCGGGSPGQCFACGGAGEPCCFDVASGVASCNDGLACGGGVCR